MKYRAIILLTLVFTLLNVQKSFAAKDDYYIRLDVGYNKYNNEDTTIVTQDSLIHNSRFNFKESESYNFGFGYNINKILRADIIASYRKIDFDLKPVTTTVLIVPQTTTINSKSLMANGYINILPIFNQNNSPINPYLSFGAGYANQNIKTIVTNHGTVFGGESNNLIWKIGAGLDVEVNDDLYLDFSYSYNDLGVLETGTGGTVFINGIRSPASTKLTTQEVMVGIRCGF